MQRKARLEPDDDVYGHPPSRRARHRKKRKRTRLLPRLQDEAQAAELDELVEKTFEGSLPAFIAAFARKTKLSQDEVDRLRAMIDGYEENRP
ncbi:MAG: BlaI/MecI/CopY family transcriptional regulator [Acutalibacteraceae bacterium]